MIQIQPYLTFKKTAEALKYYEEIFNASILEIMTEEKDTVVHAELTIENNKIYAADRFENDEDFNQSILFSVDYAISNLEDVKRIEALFNQIVSHPETKLIFEITEQPWGGTMGKLQDKFGLTWIFSGN